MENLDKFAGRETEDVLDQVRRKMDEGASDAANIKGQTLRRVESLLILLRDNLDVDIPERTVLKVEFHGQNIINFIKDLRTLFPWGLKKAKKFKDFAAGGGAYIKFESGEEAKEFKRELEKIGAEVEFCESNPVGGNNVFENF